MIPAKQSEKQRAKHRNAEQPEVKNVRTLQDRGCKNKIWFGKPDVPDAYARERELLRDEKVLYDLYFFRSKQRERKLVQAPHLGLYLADFNVP